MPHTRYEIEMFHNLGRIARALERIAKCLEEGTPESPVQAGKVHGSIGEATTTDERK